MRVKVDERSIHLLLTIDKWNLASELNSQLARCVDLHPMDYRMQLISGNMPSLKEDLHVEILELI